MAAVVRQALRLVEGAPGTLQLDAEAVNTRDREVHRNLWFNTRVPATSRVFVPVASPGDARLRADGSEVYDGPVALSVEGVRVINPMMTPDFWPQRSGAGPATAAHADP